MNCDDIKMMISEYFDNQLPKGKESFLFTHLSTCGDCRIEFILQNRIQHEVKINQKDVSERLEEKVFATITKKSQEKISLTFRNRMLVSISYTAAIVFIIVATFFFVQSINYRQEIKTISERLDIQEKMFKKYYNSNQPDENAINVQKAIIVS